MPFHYSHYNNIDILSVYIQYIHLISHLVNHCEPFLLPLFPEYVSTCWKDMFKPSQMTNNQLLDTGIQISVSELRHTEPRFQVYISQMLKIVILPMFSSISQNSKSSLHNIDHLPRTGIKSGNSEPYYHLFTIAGWENGFVMAKKNHH